VRKNIRKALRKFADDDGPPDMATYKSLLSLKADLLGEASSRFFAEAQPSDVQIAAYMADDDGDSDEDPSDRDDTEKSAKDSPPGGGQKPGKEDNEVQKSDVDEAIDIATNLAQLGLIKADNFKKAVSILAGSTDNVRKDWAAMVQLIMEPAQAESQPTPQLPSNLAPNMRDVLAKNMVGVASREDPRGQDQTQLAGLGMMGLFNSGRRAPLFGGGMSQMGGH